MTVSTRSTLLVALAAAVAACLGTAVASEIGSGAQTLTDGYAVQWFASEDSLTLTFNFRLSNWNGGASKGWLGFGIGELTSGSMVCRFFSPREDGGGERGDSFFFYFFVFFFGWSVVATVVRQCPLIRARFWGWA